MSGKDPAAARFAAINISRILGVGCAVSGLLIVADRAPIAMPHWLGYFLIVSGLLDVFIVPAFLARKWRTPK